MSVFQALTEGTKTNDRATLAEATASKAARILQENKWEGRYKEIEGMLESSNVRTKQAAGVTVQVMHNLATLHENVKARLGEAVISSNLGSMALLTPRVVDVVGIFYPNMISHLITDIQALDRSTGEIFILRPKYSNTAAGVTAGEEIFTNITDGTYASEEITGTAGTADGATTDFAVTQSVGLIRPNTLTISIDGKAVAKDAGNGALAGNGVSGTVDYAAGTFTISFGTAPENGKVIVYNAWLDSEADTSVIREVEFEIAAQPVTARAHPLKYKVSVQSQLIAMSHLDIDVNDVLTQEAAGLIKQERDIRMVDTIVNAATPYALLNFDASMNNVYYAKRDKYGEISIKVDQAQSLINQSNGRGGVGFVIAGINATNLFRCVPGFEEAADAATPIGPFKAGTIKNGTVPVVSVPKSNKLGDNDFICGFRGYQVGDSATILAEWIPLYFTALWEDPTLINHKGMLSMYDLFVNRASYLVKGTVSNYAA